MNKNEENEIHFLLENLHSSPPYTSYRGYYGNFQSQIFLVFIIFVHRNSHKVVVFNRQSLIKVVSPEGGYRKDIVWYHLIKWSLGDFIIPQIPRINTYKQMTHNLKSLLSLQSPECCPCMLQMYHHRYLYYRFRLLNC